ncbi:MAG: hypothetical protein IKW64_05375 [Clostridia bacterium]|nr:hypothetical protein [Clostridia bacterium]
MLDKIRKWFNVGVLSNNQLKMIAIVTMTVDHIGSYILKEFLILRIIGRLAYPIFAYMIAEGCKYTKNRKKYLGMMSVLAFAYQTVFFAVTKSLHQCILVTFSLSIALIYIIDYARAKRSTQSKALVLLAFLTVFLMTETVPRHFNNIGFDVDYRFFGVLVPIAVYVVDSWRDKLFMFAFSLVLLAGYFGGIQWFSLLTVPLLAVYNERRGKANLKYFFYIYYPLHLAVIYLIGFFVR